MAMGTHCLLFLGGAFGRDGRYPSQPATIPVHPPISNPHQRNADQEPGVPESPNPPAAPPILPQPAIPPLRAPPQPARHNYSARHQCARAEGHPPNGPGGRPRPNPEYYFNGIKVDRNNPRRRPRPRGDSSL
ncbi:hypothetical protein PTTG_04872, partial [Puccinia triticina 1-1 BBBD Race 1]